jgi:uncharacterized protein (TIGR02147 family)
LNIFDFKAYKPFTLAWIKSREGLGRGQLTRIAKHLEIHSTMMTHVFRGSANLSLEQALKLADFFSLNELETDYLVSLVQLERAGDKRTREFCLAKVDELRIKKLNLSNRINVQNELSDADRARYYSSWMYSYLRLLTAVTRFQSEEALAKESRLPLSKVREATEFLKSRGLCIEKNGRLEFGPVPTYVESSSPLVARHHLNWRQVAQEKFDRLSKEDLVFTYPTVISETDFEKLREKLVKVIDDFKKTCDESPSENLYCLNIDWLKISS